MTANDERNRYWWCGGNGVGHVIGEQVYCQHNGRRVKGLWFYLQSLSAIPESKPERGLLIVGDAPIVPCTKCANTTQWWANQSAQLASFDRLMARYPEGKKALEQMLEK